MRTMRWLLLAALLAPLPAAAVEKTPCLSQSEVKGSRVRYHLIDGQQCWYAVTSAAAKPASAKPASAKPASAKPDAAREDTAKLDGDKADSSPPDAAKPDAAITDAAITDAAKPDAGAPTAAADAIDVDPYGDPIWQQSKGHTAPPKPRRPKPSAVGGPLILVPSSAYTR